MTESKIGISYEEWKTNINLITIIKPQNSRRNIDIIIFYIAMRIPYLKTINRISKLFERVFSIIAISANQTW